MKRLFLSNTDKKIAGVCGGIGEMLDIDPTIVRLVTVVLGLVTGIVPFVIGYLIAWWIVPYRNQDTSGVHQGTTQHYDVDLIEDSHISDLVSNQSSVGNLKICGVRFCRALYCCPALRSSARTLIGFLNHFLYYFTGITT